MIGTGSMGGGMALLFASHGVHVSLHDPSSDAMSKIASQAERDGLASRISSHDSYKSLAASLGSPRVFVFSLPHGSVGDTVFDGLMPYLERGDMVIDAGNEHWKNTERRMGRAVLRGIRYVGMGVSGGYQAARRGPSMCPGGDDRSLEMVLPLLEKVAAKDAEGKACVAKCGLGGSGHYVKMIHNGIEHGMMSAVAEAWSIMVHGLGMGEQEIGETFKKWDAEGELVCDASRYGVWLVLTVSSVVHSWSILVFGYVRRKIRKPESESCPPSRTRSCRYDRSQSAYSIGS